MLLKLETMRFVILLAKGIQIAKFMGATQIEPTSSLLKFDLGTRHIVSAPANFKFHTSWEWLMPVVRKIVEICIEDGSTGDGELFASDEYTAILDTVPLAVIEDAFRVVAEFVEFYEKRNT